MSPTIIKKTVLDCLFFIISWAVWLEHAKKACSERRKKADESTPFLF